MCVVTACKILCYCILIGIGASVAGYEFALHRALGPASDHLFLRSKAIFSQASQHEFRNIVVGDSIVEFAYLDDMCGQATLNAGVGGATIEDAKQIVERLVAITNPRLVVLSVGVNNAIIDKPLDEDRFYETYVSIVKLIRDQGSRVAISYISPVGNGMVLGTRHYDPKRIASLNKKIGSVEKALLVPVVRFDKLPAMEDGTIQPKLTTDGVHLSSEGYKLWRTLLDGACS